MVLNNLFNALSRQIPAHPTEDITQSESFEASQGIIAQAQAIAVEEVASSENKPSEGTMVHAFRQSLTSSSNNSDQYQGQMCSPFRPRPHQESRPIAIPTGQTSYDHADEQMTSTTEYTHFLHCLREHRGPLSESILLREHQHFRTERGESIVGSPEDGHRATLLLPGVLPLLSAAPKSCDEFSPAIASSTATLPSSDGFSEINRQEDSSNNYTDNEEELAEYEFVELPNEHSSVLQSDGKLRKSKFLLFR